MPPCSWPVPGQEARHVDEGDERDVEGVAEAHEARGLDRAVDVEHAREHLRLVGDDADGAPVEAREADDDVLRAVLVDLEERAVVDDAVDDVVHVVGLVRACRGRCGRAVVHALGRVRRLETGRLDGCSGQEASRR